MNKLVEFNNLNKEFLRLIEIKKEVEQALKDKENISPLVTFDLSLDMNIVSITFGERTKTFNLTSCSEFVSCILGVAITLTIESLENVYQNIKDEFSKNMEIVYQEKQLQRRNINDRTLDNYTVKLVKDK